jgi:hypothetical protein
MGLEIEEKKETYEQQNAEFFDNRAKQMRIFLIFILGSNTLFQVSSLFTTSTREGIIIQSIYWVCTIVITVLIGVSYKSGRLDLVKYSYIIMTERMILRLFNFENTE